MRKFLIASVAAVCIAGSVSADGHGPAIAGVIQSQIDAFLADDFATAFTFASPGIRMMFGSSERFGSMVRDGYPMVWRPAEVTYLDLETEGGRPVQKVLITDQSGVPHVLKYYMIETENGWQINGVTVLEAGALGA
ncbi:MAG: DUF4864 domain-containing protein [Pseudomonadota bacterium]